MSDVKWSRNERASELQDLDAEIVFGTVVEYLGNPPQTRWWAEEGEGDGEAKGFPTREAAEQWIEARWLKGGTA